MHKTACICVTYVHSYMKVYLHWGPSVRGSSSWLPEPAVQQTAAVALCTIFDLVNLQFGSRIFNLQNLQCASS